MGNERPGRERVRHGAGNRLVNLLGIGLSRNWLAILIALLSACGGGDSGNSAPPAVPLNDVLYGQISDIPESRSDWIWGDSINWLCQQWSKNTSDSGFFYGTNFPWSNADVYVLEATSDPLAVVAAENFAYTADSVRASEGETVFFRGRNGFFGAWTIDEIDDQTQNLLSGTWYFKAGGSGDFTGTSMVGSEPIQQGNCSVL